jgi:hypothetical protein
MDAHCGAMDDDLMDRVPGPRREYPLPPDRSVTYGHIATREPLLFMASRFGR